MGKIKWFKEQRYLINLPKFDNDHPSDEKINGAVEHEYDDNLFLEYSNYIKANWNKYDKILSVGLSQIEGVDIQNEYVVNLTKYGTGGSFGGINTIIINIAQRKLDDIMLTIVHEIIHLSIDKLIIENHTDHWVKERTVDLLVNKFFPDMSSMQNVPIPTEDIDKQFHAFYPDIVKVIKSVSKSI